MKIRVEKSKGFEKMHIPEGMYHAEFIAVRDAPDGKYGERIALDFNVYLNRTDKPVNLGRVFGKKVTKKTQLYDTLVAIGATLEEEADFNIDSLIGNRCRVVVEDYKDNEGKMVSGITKVKSPGEDTHAFIEAAGKTTASGQADPIVTEEFVIDQSTP